MTFIREKFSWLKERPQPFTKQEHWDRIERLSNEGAPGSWQALLEDGQYLPHGQQVRVDIKIPSDPSQTIDYVPEVINKIPRIFVHESVPHLKFFERGTKFLAPISRYLERLKRRNPLFISISGYSSSSNGYLEDAVVVQHVFHTLAEHDIHASLVLHGGTRYGVPAVANTLATEYGLERIGCMPARGLHSPIDVPDGYNQPPLDTMIIKGLDYGDETDIIGSTPDVLISVGGGSGSVREIEYALKEGKLVVLVRLDKRERSLEDGREGAPTNVINWNEKVIAMNWPGKIVEVDAGGTGKDIDLTKLDGFLQPYLAEWKTQDERGNRRAL